METKYMPKYTRKPFAKELAEVKDLETLKKTKETHNNKLLVLLLWKPGQTPSQHIKDVCDALAHDCSFTVFLSVFSGADDTDRRTSTSRATLRCWNSTGSARSRP